MTIFSSKQPVIRLIYLLAIAISLFFIHSALILTGVLVFQLILWQASHLKWSLLLRSLKRLGIFFVIILLSYAFIATETKGNDHWIDLNVFSVNLTGVSLAIIMCLRIFTLVLVSLWVQNISKDGEFVTSLKYIGIPNFLSIAIDVSLILLTANYKSDDSSGSGSGSGSGKDSDRHRHQHNKKKNGIVIALKQLIRGDLSFLHDLIEKALARTEKHITKNYPEISKDDARDIAIIAGMTVAMMGLKFIQLMPGLPIAPGHKNLLMLPMFLLASQLTHCRFGGLWTGITLGVINFLFGFGKFGILELLQFAVPGLLADLLLPMARATSSHWVRVGMFALIGGILGLGRFSANLGVLVLAGTPFIAVLALLPMLFSQIIFGILSGVVSAYILSRNFLATPENSSLAEQKNLARKSET